MTEAQAGWRQENWLRKHVHKPKGPDYARRVLAGYRMGRRSGGAIAGVRVLTAPDSCPTCRAIGGIVYDLDGAPAIPVAGCTHPDGCRCTYTPFMTYDVAAGSADTARPTGGAG